MCPRTLILLRPSLIHLTHYRRLRALTTNRSRYPSRTSPLSPRDPFGSPSTGVDGRDLCSTYLRRRGPEDPGLRRQTGHPKTDRGGGRWKGGPRKGLRRVEGQSHKLVPGDQRSTSGPKAYSRLLETLVVWTGGGWRRGTETGGQGGDGKRADMGSVEGVRCGYIPDGRDRRVLAGDITDATVHGHS